MNEKQKNFHTFAKYLTKEHNHMIIEGEIFQFKSFFLANFNTIVRFISVYIGNTEESQDIAQETFLRIYENWGSLYSPEEIRSFMYTTAHNLCISKLRHRNVEEQFAQKIKEENSISQESDIAKEVTYQETIRLLRQAIDKLPRQSRLIILLGLDGKNNNEIAHIMGISVNTVKTLKKNAYKTLRSQLNNYPKEYFILVLFLLYSISYPDIQDYM